MTSCGTNKESAYKKAYEKAMAQESQNQQTEAQTDAPVVTPLTTETTDQATKTNVDNATVRSENVTLVDGSGLKAYSVVVGSFSLKANAVGLQNTLKQGGYDAQIAYNSNVNMYRVVATTYDDKASAVESRDALRNSQYNPKGDAWLLYKN
jgi:cell division septation protein DedD